MMAIFSASQWASFLAQAAGAHLLQSAAWGEAKAAFGWRAVRICEGSTGAQVLLRQLPLGFTAAYLPKGPVGAGWQALWPSLHQVCRRNRAIFLKVEPDAWEPVQPEIERQMAGFLPSKPIQPRRTVVISLVGSEADWLARMKQKTRYNIRLAERKGVHVCESQDYESFYRLMQQTSLRDGFAVHSADYYRRTHQVFHQHNQAVLLMASYEGQPLAGLMAFAFGQRAYYLYGASGEAERNRMPTYLLQWEAMRWAAARGCLSYDLYGIPDVEEEQLEQEFSDRADGLWGVYRFKRGFGGQVLRSVGAWDYVYQPALYNLYRWYASRRGEAA